MKLKKPIVLCFEIDEQNYDNVNRVNPWAIPDLEKALVELGPLPAGSRSKGGIVIYCVSVDYTDFSVADMLVICPPKNFDLSP